MSSNQIGGFFNRLEGSRKYLFGSVGVLGEANNSVISGVFITRGDDIKLTIDCAPDWESYEYKKLDLANDSDKKFFEDALAWDLELDGKKWADGKNVSTFDEFSSADDLTSYSVQVTGWFARCRYVERSCCRVVSSPCLLYCIFLCDVNLRSTEGPKGDNWGIDRSVHRRLDYKRKQVAVHRVVNGYTFNQVVCMQAESIQHPHVRSFGNSVPNRTSTTGTRFSSA